MKHDGSRARGSNCFQLDYVVILLNVSIRFLEHFVLPHCLRFRLALGIHLAQMRTKILSFSFYRSVSMGISWSDLPCSSDDGYDIFRGAWMTTTATTSRRASGALGSCRRWPAAGPMVSSPDTDPPISFPSALARLRGPSLSWSVRPGLIHSRSMVAVAL